MAVTVRDLLKLRLFKGVISLVSDKSGIDKAVTWPYIKQTRELKPWLNGGEIIFILGNEGESTPEEQVGLIKEGVEDKVAAFVFLCGGERVKRIDDSVINYANSINMPVFTMPYNVKLIDVTKEISNAVIESGNREKMVLSFINDLLHKNYRSEEHIIKQGYEFGINLEQNFIAIIIQTDFEYETKDYSKIMSYRNKMGYILKGIEQIGAALDIQLISAFNIEESVCLAFSENNQRLAELLVQTNEHLKYYFDNSVLSFFAGSSSVHSGVNGCLSAVEEARRASEFAKRADGRSFCRYDEMGILKVLTDSKVELLSYCRGVLGTLIDFDTENNTDYMLTVKTYLENNYNLAATAGKLFIHRNTLINRIKRIEQLTKRDLKRADVMVEYMCVFKILEFLL